MLVGMVCVCGCVGGVDGGMRLSAGALLLVKGDDGWVIRPLNPGEN